LLMTLKKWVGASICFLLFATFFVVSKPNALGAWSLTSPQVSVSVFGGTLAEGGQSVAVDSSGNIYTAGYFQGTVDFDPGAGTANLTSAGANDFFVSKLDASGNYVWAKSFGGSSTEWGFTETEISVAVDSLGNVYTVGNLYSTVDFDPGAGTANLTSGGADDVFVLKMDASGNYVWAKSFGGTNVNYASNDRGFSVAVDSLGNVYTSGDFGSTVDFDPGTGSANLTSTGAVDAFVSKLDASGNYVWAKSFGGTGIKSETGSSALSVAVDSSGNVYTTGPFTSRVDFDPGVGTVNLTSTGSRDAFVSKLDASGNYVWAKRFGGVFRIDRLNSAIGLSLAVDSLANVHTTGNFTGTVDFDPGTGLANVLTDGNSDVFVLKLDASSGSTLVKPGVPTNVSATNAANAQSVVSWTAPAFTGGVTITGYTVTSSPDGRTCGWTTGALSCTVTGLTNGTSYTFSVTATNANGTGSASDASSSITPTAAQSITFLTVDTQLLGKKTVALSATSTSSQAIVFTSATTTVCTVSGSTVTMLTIGNCTINANQGGGSGWDAAPQVSKTFTILPSPPVGEPGVSIKNGNSYSNSKQVTLNLIWPEYATSARISNDGGFAASKTQTKDLAASIDWELDDSVKGINTKVVYVRFNGVADTTKTYSDDIVLDTAAPTIETSTAAIATSAIDLSVRATDDITGVNTVQVRNGTKMVTKDYASKISIPLVDLSLSVSSSGVRKSAVTSVEIRVSDNAGNWTGWQSVTVAGLSTPTVTTPTLTTPTVTMPKVTISRSATAKSIAAYAKIKVLSTSKVSLKIVSSYAKYCKVTGAMLKGVKAGFCKVTVTVTPKKGRATSKTVTLKVTK
jgi:hypothetical protein